ncbi:LOW QUALITY PROTEIN: inositol phosphate kinase 1 [Aphomia sociella]
MDSLGDSWKYIAEGNAHIVIGILNTNYVLRKDDAKKMDLDSVQKSVDFVNLVMTPLLICGNFNFNQLVLIPAEDLEVLSKKLFHLRPEHRREKTILSSFAIKSLNLTMITPMSQTNYCVEIKPKEGYISKFFENVSKCYYCLKQLLKYQQKQIDRVSHYCPLDLFSGEKPRMRNAILNLIDNPQNNFKLFLNGNVIYDDKSKCGDLNRIICDMSVFNGSIELFIDFIIEILLSNQCGLDVVNSTEYTKTSKCVENLNILPGTILYKLLWLQKLSDTLSLDLNTDCDDYEYVTIILEQLKLYTLDLSIEEDKKTFFSICDPNHLAMISAVAKDCSIMISFDPNHNNFPYIEFGGKKTSCRLSVTDLEPKSTKTLLKRKKTERKLLDIYEKSLKSSGL